MHPKKFFETENIETDAGTCFVIMPFKIELQEIYDVIREAIEEELNFSCQRADDNLGAGYVMDTVLRGIGESEFVIADITDSNPNVFYELGIAHMVKSVEKVIILRQTIQPVPFDLSPFRYIDYQQSISGAKQLRDKLIRAIKETADLLIVQKIPYTKYQFRLRNRTAYKFPKRLRGEGDSSFGFELCADDVGEDIVKLTFKFTRHVAGMPPAELPPLGEALMPGQSYMVPFIPWYLEIEKLSGKVATLNLVSVQGF